MAYTIVKSDGTILTTIADGQINTTSTSLGLPGRNYAGYGQTLDTNFVHMIENFADSQPPPNPLRGQLWYNTNNQTLYVCPEDGETIVNAWFALASTSSGATTFGSVTVTGNLTANNASITNNLIASNISCTNINVANSAVIENATAINLEVGNFETQNITTGGSNIAGNITGNWSFTPGSTLNTTILSSGGSNTLANVTGIWTFENQLNTRVLSTGANTTTGNITGNWTLTAGSRLQATYADLAERFEADQFYDAGTVVEIGGDKEITAVKYELSEDIFGVISNSAAYLMNSGAGNDYTHPPVAVSGRVYVKTIGKVTKGQRLVSAGNGIARAANNEEINAFNTIGRALENKYTQNEGLVEAIVTIK